MKYWEMFREMDALRRELDRTFNRDTGRSPFSRVAFLPGLAARQYPMINLSDDKDSVYIEALAPGVNPGTLEITVLNNAVTISGEKTPGCEGIKPEDYHRCERAAGKFVRSVELSSPVDENKVKAEYKNGLLTITLPKAESAKPKRVAITAG